MYSFLSLLEIAYYHSKRNQRSIYPEGGIACSQNGNFRREAERSQMSTCKEN